MMEQEISQEEQAHHAAIRCQDAISTAPVSEQIRDVARVASGWRVYEGREGESFRESLGRQRANDRQSEQFGRVRTEVASLFSQACNAHYAQGDVASGARIEVEGNVSNGMRISEEITVAPLTEQQACAIKELNMMPQHIRFNEERVAEMCPTR